VTRAESKGVTTSIVGGRVDKKLQGHDKITALPGAVFFGIEPDHAKGMTNYTGQIRLKIL
jgi:hypothetical protein